MNIEALLARARDNSPEAQYEAYNYFFERSRKSSVSEAEREKCMYDMEFWLRKAAFNNYAPAQLELARAEYDLYNDLIHGDSEKDNFKLAFIAGDCVNWYRKAIAQNYAPAVEVLENVKAFDKSINEFKARNNLTGKNPYEDLFYNEAPMAFLSGRRPSDSAAQDETEEIKGSGKSYKGLITAIAAVAIVAVALGVGAALFKDKSVDKLSPSTTAGGTTVPAIFEKTAPASAAQAQKTGVNDTANLLSEEERQALRLKIDALVYKYKFDIALLTVADTGGKDVRAYAADYYEANGYGIGENSDGLVFMINMATAEYYTSTSGYGVTAFTSGAIKEIGAAMNADLSSGSYFKAFGTYLDYVDKILLAYQNGEPYEGTTQPQGTTTVVTAASATTASAKRVAVVSTQSEPLNIRKEPVATADKLGQFARGAKVTVEGEAITDATGAKWYRCTGTDTQGAVVTGYCNASFLTF